MDPIGALADALNVLEGTGRGHRPEPVALRVAKHDGALILDLGLPDGAPWSSPPASGMSNRNPRCCSGAPGSPPRCRSRSETGTGSIGSGRC